MSYLQSIVQTFADDITRNRKYNYSHDGLEEYLLSNPHLGCSTFKIINKRNENLQTMLLKNKKSNTCIIYCHGLGSNKLQSLSLAKYFTKYGFDICAFDFSGSGRSDGNYTSYGLLEQEDIHSVLAHLDSHHSYDMYILWGRSMGSVSIILSQGFITHKKVACIILDSPFSSFQKVAVEIASKKSFIPQFMMQLLIEPLKAFCSSHHAINPFEINITQRLQRIDCKILIIYSRNDSIVSYTHSLELSKECRRTPVQIQIQEDHNMQRSRETFQQILTFIQRNQQEVNRRNMISRSKTRGITITSKQGKESTIKNRSKIKLCISQSNIHDQEGKTIKTITGFNKSIQYSKRLDTDTSSKRRHIGSITSLCMEERMSLLANKQNVKPSLNLMRKNRFR